MESKQRVKPEKTVSKGDHLKFHSKTLSSEGDSAISITFDSADCGYKSGDISTPLSSSKELLSNSSISSDCGYHSKCDQNLRFDSGSEGYLSECQHLLDESSQVFEPQSPILNKKLQWQDIFTPDKDGDTFLHLAIVEARSDVIFPLIRLAPHPDFLDISNDLYQTPLHMATLTGKSHIVRRLAVAGATLDIQDHSGNTPLHIACRSGDLDCVQAILTEISESEIKEAGSVYQIYIEENNLSYLINMKNFEGLSCVHLAALGGWKKVLDCLFKHNADINEQDGKSGRTALHHAVESENYELVQLLLNCNANPLVRNYAGQTSLNVASSLNKRNPTKHRQRIVDLLRSSAEKWDSSCEFESDSSSDESEIYAEAIKTIEELERSSKK